MARNRKQPLTIPAAALALLQRAEKGDSTVVPELRRFLDQHPEVWQAMGDLAQQAEAAWLDLASGITCC